jgi:hypothetical protein
MPHMAFMFFFLHTHILPCAVVNTGTRLAISLERHRMVLYGKNLVLTTRRAWVFQTIKAH